MAELWGTSRVVEAGQEETLIDVYSRAQTTGGRPDPFACGGGILTVAQEFLEPSAQRPAEAVLEWATQNAVFSLVIDCQPAQMLALPASTALRLVARIKPADDSLRTSGRVQVSAALRDHWQLTSPRGVVSTRYTSPVITIPAGAGATSPVIDVPPFATSMIANRAATVGFLQIESLARDGAVVDTFFASAADVRLPLTLAAGTTQVRYLDTSDVGGLVNTVWFLSV